MKRFADKNVLVTGGTTGIGRAIAAAFLRREGARVLHHHGRDAKAGNAARSRSCARMARRSSTCPATAAKRAMSNAGSNTAMRTLRQARRRGQQCRRRRRARSD